MRVREHKGFGHGLEPGQEHDMNCGSCNAEQVQGIKPRITGTDDAKPASTFQQRESVKRLYGICKTQAKRHYGNFISFVSPTIFRALVADEILHLLYAQDDKTDAETIRKLVNGLSELLMDDEELN